MKHIRISGENGAGIPIPPKTISEVEEMAEFKEMKNLEELIEYMHRLTANKNKEYYLYALSVVGLDGTGFSGRITYESDQIMEKKKSYMNMGYCIWGIYSKSIKAVLAKEDI